VGVLEEEVEGQNHRQRSLEWVELEVDRSAASLDYYAAGLYLHLLLYHLLWSLRRNVSVSILSITHHAVMLVVHLILMRIVLSVHLSVTKQFTIVLAFVVLNIFRKLRNIFH
jgi:hypothetical protein